MRLVGQSKLRSEGISSCSKIWMFEGCDQNTQEKEILDQCLHRENGFNKWLQELKEQDDINRAKYKRN